MKVFINYGLNLLMMKNIKTILAKTYRDDFMDTIHEEFPMYNWKKNKGYPTKEHREAIRKYGITKYHRKTFRLLPEQLLLEL